MIYRKSLGVDLCRLEKRSLQIFENESLLFKSEPKTNLYHSLIAIYRKGQWFTVHKGPKFSTSIVKPETDLTADMLVSSVHRIR